MEHNDLPELLAGVQVVDHPLPESRGVTDECRRRSVESIPAGQVVVEEVRICVEEQKVRIAVVERIVALVIDLQVRSLAGVNLGRVPQRVDRRRLRVRESLIAEREAGGYRSIDVPRVLDVKARRAILREIKIIEK